jgi:adenosine deaminase
MFAQAAEQRTSAYFDSIRRNPLLLEAFIREMPKGGDLHNHLSGAVYAEHYIEMAVSDKLCVSLKTMSFAQPPCDSGNGLVAAADVQKDSVLDRELIDALSMRAFQPREYESGEDHFFDTFGKFRMVSSAHTGEMLAEVVSRAGHQNQSYLELTLGLDRISAALGTKVGWDDDFNRLAGKLAEAGINDAVAQMKAALDRAEAQKDEILGCRSTHPDLGCKVTVRYIYEVYRGTPREQVFAETMAGFLMAHEGDRRFVSVNPVMPEDGYISMSDYHLHMKIFAYFHKLHPGVHLTMHAGELAPSLVPPQGLRFHIREAVEIAGAERIGHGVDVMQEDRPLDLLKEMAQKHVAVEICLTSNDQILGITGDRHPFPIYLKYGVPMVIATDDEGVSRSDPTHEYLRATQSYGLSYVELKKLVHNSIEYSFAEPELKAKLLGDLNASFRKFEASW